MHQKQTKIPERASAEDEDVLDIFFWAYGEEPHDCHQIDGGLLKEVKRHAGLHDYGL